MAMVPSLFRSTTLLLLLNLLFSSFTNSELEEINEENTENTFHGPDFLDQTCKETTYFAFIYEYKISPEVRTKDITVILGPDGIIEIAEDEVDDGSTSPAGSLYFNTNITSFGCNDVGENMVTLTVTDSDGNSSSGEARVTVLDNTPPIAATKNISIQLDNVGAASIIAAQVDNGSSDACGLASIEVSPKNFDCSNVGANTVSLLVTDNNGLQITATATVTIEDNDAPEAIAKDITVQLDENGTASITAEQIDNGSNDACGIAAMEVSPNTFDCSNIGANTVSLLVTDNHGLQSTTTALVTIQDNVAPKALAKDITVQLNKNGSAAITADQVDNGSSDACGIASMEVSPNTFDCSNIGINTVMLTVIDNNGLESTTTATVTVEESFKPDLPIIEDILSGCAITVEPPVANDLCSGEIEGKSSDPLTYSSPGKYVIHWSFDDGHGNISEATQNVTIDPIKPKADITHVACHGSSTGSVSISASGGNAPYTFVWNTLPDGSTQSELLAGTYLVTVTDAEGCSAETIEVIINEPDPIEILDISISTVTCNGGDNGSLKIDTVTGGTGQYRYSVNSSEFTTQKSYSGLVKGDYVVTVRDERGCEYSETVNITEPEELSMATPVSTDVTCFGGNDGSISAGEVSGGVSPYSYSTDNIQFQDHGEFTGVPAGRHSIFVIDANGCAYESLIDVGQPEELTASIHKGDVSCHGESTGEVSLSNPTGGSGNYEFSADGVNWHPGNATINYLAAGDHDIILRDAEVENCFRTIGSVSITQPEPISGEVTSARTTIYGTATANATVSAAGGCSRYIFEWRIAGEDEVIRNTQSVSNMAAGDYIVTVIDAEAPDCSLEIPFKIIDNIRASILPGSNCESIEDIIRTSRFQVEMDSIAGGVGSPMDFTYEWHFGEGVTSIERIASNNQIETLSPNQDKYVGAIDDSFKVKYSAAGDRTITLWITDKTEPQPVTTQFTFDHYVGECFETCGASQDFIIDPDSFYIGDKDGIPVDGKDCDNSTEKYLWLTILKSSTAHALNVELMYSVNDGETTYSRKALNCFGEKIMSGNKEGEWTQIIVEDEPLKYKLFQIVSGSDSQSEINWSCGQTFNIEGLNLRWVTNSKWDCDNSTNKSCLSLPTDVDVSTPIIATATAENILCNGDSTGSITINTSGGVRPFYYSITGDEEDNYVESRQFFDLPAGDYLKIWVKDGRGAKFHIEDTIRITEPGPLVIDRIEKTEPECFGDTGEITIYASGGTPFEGEEYEYKYLWNDIYKQDTKTAEGLPEGTYTVTIIDANGCQIIESVTITEPEDLTRAEAGESQSIGCGFFSTFLNATSATIGFGKWSVTAYPDTVAPEDIIIEDPESPISKFRAPEGSYTLRWTISNEDSTCSNYSETTVEFEGDCENLDFDGVDDYIYVGDHYNFPSTEFTLEAWIKPEAINGNRTIISKGDWRNPSAGGYELLINNGAPTFRWNGTSVTSSHKVSTSRWYHISVVFTSNRADIYVDGIGVGNRTVSSFPGITSKPFLIGGMYDSSHPEKPQSLFHGWIEELRIWNTTLTLDQIRFMMNQRIGSATTTDNTTVVKGEMLPMNVPGPLNWGSLKGYFRLMAKTEQIENGTTPNLAPDSPEGYLKNIQSFQRNSAPLPYISEVDGKWNERATWDQNIGEDNEKWWEYPNALGINGTSIDWNIAYVDKTLLSGERDITLLALMLSDTLEMEGANPERINGTIVPGTGNGLTISKFLRLNGKIDLNGESQLVQTEGSILEGSGTLERDQQGTASSYNYNYWTSPVSTAEYGQNSGYTMEEVLRDGSDPSDPKEIDFNYQYHYADGAKTDPIRISTYWLNKFFGTANQYSQWRHVGHTGKLKAGEGVSMKGSSGNSEIKDLQNYIFTGIPNNGTIELGIGENQNYLVGNPYPSALDADEFIRDNLANRRNGQNIFNGTLYFWDHFSGKTHYLEEYIGGYAIFNLSGGVRAISNDERINNDTTNGEYKEGEKIPQRFIPVGQAFFLSTKLDEAIESSEIPANVDGGNIRFRNSQRVFVKENADSSVFHSQESTQKREKEKIENRSQIWLKFDSPTGYHRQLLVTADQEATNGFDIGFDAILIENNAEDMYWYFNEVEFIIQGVPHFNKEQVLPLGIKIKKNSEFTIRIDDLKNVPEDMEIYLEDKLNNILHDLRTGDYTSISDPGTINDRFQLIFQNQDTEPGEGEGEEGEEGEDGDEDGDGNSEGDESGNENSGEGEELTPKGLELFYVRDTKEIIIRNPQLVTIYNTRLSNALGQQIKDYGDTPEIKEIKLPVNDLGTGVYLISVVTENGTLIHKIIIE